MKQGKDNLGRDDLGTNTLDVDGADNLSTHTPNVDKTDNPDSCISNIDNSVPDTDGNGGQNNLGISKQPDIDRKVEDLGTDTLEVDRVDNSGTCTPDIDGADNLTIRKLDADRNKEADNLGTSRQPDEDKEQKTQAQAYQI